MLFNGANIKGHHSLANANRCGSPATSGHHHGHRRHQRQCQLAGGDIIRQRLSATAVKQVNLDRAVPGVAGGDGQADTIISTGPTQPTACSSERFHQLHGGRLRPRERGQLRGPQDKLAVNLLGGAFDATALPAGIVAQLTVDGGTGNDSLTGSQGADSLLGGDGDDLVTGGRGNDTAFLGAGNDTFVWSPGDGSDIVEGQDGSDSMVFNGANVNENIDISANGSRVRFFRDVANVTMDLNGVETVDFNALDGADTIR